MLALVLLMTLAVQDEEPPVEDLRAGGDDKKRYFLIGPAKGAKEPAGGPGLVVVLPGGDGSAEFHPFVKSIARNALGDGYVVAQLVAVEWSPGQSRNVVWPTEKSTVEKMKFTTEEFAEAVIEEVARRRKLNAARVYTLSWSSGGPAAYSLSLRPKRLVKGSFVAMSVFHPGMLPPLGQAKGHAYFLYHSEGDETCKFRLAEDAQKKLGAAGARVELKKYEGGHGWTGDTYADIREGVRWLEKNAKGK